jgi:hypothetical protein
MGHRQGHGNGHGQGDGSWQGHGHVHITSSLYVFRVTVLSARGRLYIYTSLYSIPTWKKVVKPNSKIKNTHIHPKFKAFRIFIMTKNLL